MKGIFLSIALLSSTLMAAPVLPGPSADAMQSFLKSCETPVVIVEKTMKEKASDFVQVGYTATKPYAQKGAAIAQDFYQHPTDSLKSLSEHIHSFDSQHPGLIIKVVGGVIGVYVVYKAMKWLYGKLPSKAVKVKHISACAPRKPGEQNPKLAAFQATLKK